MDTVLEVRDLSVSYGYITALAGASFEVREGEIVTLIGSNGAGKTTSLMAISNLVDKEEGSVTFKGQDISRMAARQDRHHGHEPRAGGAQDISLADGVREPDRRHAGPPGMTRAQVQGQLDTVYSLFPRLKDRAGQGGGTLSGGEQQMLAIARGLMMDPDILMLDEPSLGLAPILVEEIFELLEEIHRTGKTILLIRAECRPWPSPSRTGAMCWKTAAWRSAAPGRSCCTTMR